MNGTEELVNATLLKVTPVITEEAAKQHGPTFEGVFAIAGLLAVAYLVLRQREG